MESLISLDQDLLFFCNKTLANGTFDLIFPNITDLHKAPGFGIVVIPVLLFLVWKNRKRFGLHLLFGAIASLGVNDFICGKLIKPGFARLRPNMAGLDVIMRSNHNDGYSFVSNHSANMFCLATFLSFYFPRWRWIFYTIAFLIAFSRVYNGVHYPSDVVGGAIIGSFIGFLGAFFLNKKIKMVKANV